ncbi:MAG: nitroreductase family protein [Candidatus Bathyarchaeota archaeon]|nr:MAG: nitroreductase family protein [Candidatus Bathyarchaeota archaeon]
MKVFEAIEKRRSIRRFKDTLPSEMQIRRLVDAARLAPSGCNVQPWRFIIVRDSDLKRKLREASFNQEFVEEAPVVFVCCGDLLSWKKTEELTREVLGRGDVSLSRECENALMNRVDKAVFAEMHERIPTTLLNVAIAIEHIVLEAVELGLGSCWVRLFDEKKVKRFLGLPKRLCVVALLPVGVPDEKPRARPRLPLSAITLSTKHLKEKGR